MFSTQTNKLIIYCTICELKIIAISKNTDKANNKNNKTLVPVWLKITNNFTKNY